MEFSLHIAYSISTSGGPTKIWVDGLWCWSPETWLHQRVYGYISSICTYTDTGWWLQPSWKMMEFVNGKDDIHIWNGKIKAMFETTNQLYIGVTYSISLTWNKAGIATPNANHHSGEVAERSRWNLPVYTCNKCIFSHVSHIVDTQFFVESTRWCPQVMLVGVHPPILSEIGVTDLAVVWLRTRFPNSFIAIMPNMEVS